MKSWPPKWKSRCPGTTFALLPGYPNRSRSLHLTVLPRNKFVLFFSPSLPSSLEMPPWLKILLRHLLFFRDLLNLSRNQLLGLLPSRMLPPHLSLSRHRNMPRALHARALRSAPSPSLLCSISTATKFTLVTFWLFCVEIMNSNRKYLFKSSAIGTLSSLLSLKPP